MQFLLFFFPFFAENTLDDLCSSFSRAPQTGEIEPMSAQENTTSLRAMEQTPLLRTPYHHERRRKNVL